MNLQCGTKRRALRRLARKAKKSIVIAEFDIEVDPARLSGMVNGMLSRQISLIVIAELDIGVDGYPAKLSGVFNCVLLITVDKCH